MGRAFWDDARGYLEEQGGRASAKAVREITAIRMFKRRGIIIKKDTLLFYMELSCCAEGPFAVPDDPIFKARSELYDDPFAEYAVPQAALRFKQGFGRLIRRKTDRGVMVVLDARIATRSYGQRFLRSLPSCTVERALLGQMPDLVSQWLERPRA